MTLWDPQNGWIEKGKAGEKRKINQRDPQEESVTSYRPTGSKGTVFVLLVTSSQEAPSLSGTSCTSYGSVTIHCLSLSLYVRDPPLEVNYKEKIVLYRHLLEASQKTFKRILQKVEKQLSLQLDSPFIKSHGTNK